MSGLEKEELQTRVKAMTEEEMKIVAKLLPDDILWEELHRRYALRSNTIATIRETVKRAKLA